MILYNHFSETYSPQYAYLYTLTVTACERRFAFAVEDEENRLIALRASQIEPKEPASGLVNSLQMVLPGDTTLRHNFRKVKFSVFGNKFSVVPAKLFDRDRPALYLQNVTPLSDNEVVCFDHLRALDAYCVYAVDEALLPYVESYFGTAQLVHWLSPLLLGFQQEAERLQKPHVFAHVWDRSLALVVYDGGKLLYANILSFASARDFLYYVLLVYDQLKLHPERTPVHLSGEVTPEAEVYKELSKYIRHLEFSARPGLYRYPVEVQRDLPGHFYQELLFLKMVE